MKTFARILGRFERFLSRLYRGAGTAMFGTLILVMLVQIFMRRVVNRPFVWAEDLNVLLFVWISYLGAAVLFGDGALIAVDMVVKALPKRIALAVGTLVDLGLFSASVYVLDLGIRFMSRQMRLGHKLGGALGLPSWALTVALVASLASMAVSSLVFVLRRVVDISSSGKGEPSDA